VKIYNHFFIADDDPDDQELFIEALHEVDELCVCVTAFDGLEALDKLFAAKLYVPDIIFLDLNMPKMNGKECLAEIKKDNVLKEVPVIIYSTSADKRDMLEALQLGAVFFLQKPNRFEELSRALKHIISYDWKRA
jgi:CheY-like chemotaxis protein